MDLISRLCLLPRVKERDSLSFSLPGMVGGLFHQCWYSARKIRSAVSILSNIIDSFFSLWLIKNSSQYQIMAQHCINNQELLAQEIQPMFSLRKTDVYKVPSVSLKSSYCMIETDYVVIVYLLAYQNILLFFVCFNSLVSNYL